MIKTKKDLQSLTDEDKRILAKVTLNLPLTPRENAIYILYLKKD